MNRAVLVHLADGRRFYCEDARIDAETGSITPAPGHRWEVVE